MASLVPLSYNIRSLFVRRASTILTMISVGATVAVIAGVLSLQQGFQSLFAVTGRDDVAVFLRPGATSEGESLIPRERVKRLTGVAAVEAIAVGEDGEPLASAETYLGIRLKKLDGGETNVPIRGVQPATFTIRGDAIRIVEGERFREGHDELIVGRPLSERLPNAGRGDTLVINRTPFKVVGIFESDGPFESEIWGDAERVSAALKRSGNFNRLIARIRPGTDLEALAERLKDDEQAPADVKSEREYLASQTTALSGTLIGLGVFLGVVMGTAAVFTGTNTMLAALASRTHEIGILLSVGFRPRAIFLSFLFEAVVLGVLGGVVGCLLAVPLHGVKTGTTNFNTFTEVAFAFRVTPTVLIVSVIFAMALGLIGGLVPAWRAARMSVTEALRRS